MNRDELLADRAVYELASELCDNMDARRIAGEVDAPSFFDSAPHVQEYWAVIAAAAIAAQGGE